LRRAHHLALHVLGRGAGVRKKLLPLLARFPEDLLLLLHQLAGPCLGFLGLFEPFRNPDLTLFHLGQEHGPGDLSEDQKRGQKGDPGPDRGCQVEVCERASLGRLGRLGCEERKAHD
jgi:hypothetical protein